MKKPTISRLLICCLTVLLLSCHQDKYVVPTKGNVTFAMSPMAKTGGRVSETATPAFVLLSITDSEGKVQENVKLSLFAFGSGYLSESLELPTGPAQLTKFAVMDATNEIVYATPTEGSVMAKFVNDPLPIEFTVTEEGVQVVPQVLAVELTDSPASFGYASFGFDIIIPTINLNISLQYPDGETYDSAYIVFRNSTGEVRKKLAVDNSTHLATGQAAITLGPWKTSISYYHQDPDAHYEKIDKMGLVNIRVLPTSTGLTSNASSISIVNDNNETQTLPIKLVDYYYYDVVLQHKIEGLIRLPKDPTNPFVEVAIWNPEKWPYIYIYADRTFYESDGTLSNLQVRGDGAFEVYSTDQRWIDLSPKGDLVDTTFFNGAILDAENQAAENKAWDIADSFIMVRIDKIGNDAFGDFSWADHLWNSSGPASGGRMAAMSPKSTWSKSEIEKRKKMHLH